MNFFVDFIYPVFFCESSRNTKIQQNKKEKIEIFRNSKLENYRKNANGKIAFSSEHLANTK